MIQLANLLSVGAPDMPRAAGFPLAATSDFALALAEISVPAGDGVVVAPLPGGRGRETAGAASGRQTLAATGNFLPVVPVPADPAESAPLDDIALPLDLIVAPVPAASATAPASGSAAPAAPAAATLRPEPIVVDFQPRAPSPLRKVAVAEPTAVAPPPVTDAEGDAVSASQPDGATGDEPVPQGAAPAKRRAPPAAEQPAVLIVAVAPQVEAMPAAPTAPAAPSTPLPSPLPAAVRPRPISVAPVKSDAVLAETGPAAAPVDGVAEPAAAPVATTVPATGRSVPAETAVPVPDHAPPKPAPALVATNDMARQSAPAVDARPAPQPLATVPSSQTLPPAASADTPSRAETASAAVVQVPSDPVRPPRAFHVTPAPVTPDAAPQPAAQVFAAAMFEAVSPRARDRRDDSSDIPSGIAAPAGLTVAAPHSTLEVKAPSAATEAPIDMTRHEWMGAMIERIETLQGEGGARETRVRLTPDALGTVDLSIAQDDGGQLQVRITADTPQARAILSEAAPRLVEMAEARGLKLGHAGVEAGTGHHDHQPRHDARQPDAPAPARPAASDTTADDGLAETDTRIA